MHRPIQFLCSLLFNQTIGNTFLETSKWTLIQRLSNFEWRIPKIWCTINQYAKGFLDHPYKAIRECVARYIKTQQSI